MFFFPKQGSKDFITVLTKCFNLINSLHPQVEITIFWKKQDYFVNFGTLTLVQEHRIGMMIP
jgi:hypothetical protein